MSFLKESPSTWLRRDSSVPPQDDKKRTLGSGVLFLSLFRERFPCSLPIFVGRNLQ